MLELLKADTCAIYEAYKNGHSGATEYLFAGSSGIKEGAPGPGKKLSSGWDEEVWLGLTSYVAHTNHPQRLDNVGAEDELTIQGDAGEPVRVRIDRAACELDVPGPFLAVPLSREGEVFGVLRVMREADSKPFSGQDEQRLLDFLPLITLIAAQERARRDLSAGLLGLAQLESESEVLEAIAEHAAVLVRGEVQGVAVFLKDPSLSSAGKNVFTFRAPKKVERKVERKRYSPGDSGFTPHVLGGNSLLIVDKQREAEQLAHLGHTPTSGEIDEGTTQSFVAVPIFHPNASDPKDVIGAIRLSSPLPYSFTQRDVETLQAIAKQTAWIVQRLWGQDVLFRTLVDTSEDAILAVDSEGRVTVLNEAVRRLIGLSPEEARKAHGRSIVDVAYAGNPILARETKLAIREAHRKGAPLEDYYLLCYKRCEKSRHLMPIPMRLRASFLRKPGESRDTPDFGSGRGKGSIGILEDLRCNRHLDHVVTFGRELTRDTGEQDQESAEADDKLYQGITLDVDLAAQVQKVDRLTPHHRSTKILIRGETGTGKEVLADSVHRAVNSSEDIRKLNCATLNETLHDTELFGVEDENVYTGAKERPGLFAHDFRGTVFLDEVAELRPSVQASLLRALEGKVRRVGSNEERTVDIHVISATNRDLAELVKKGEFRADLWNRLKGKKLTIPPLRERRADIMLLADHFRDQEVRRLKSGPIGFSSGAIQALLSYSWPGNVRELKDAVVSAVGECVGAGQERVKALIPASAFNEDILDARHNPTPESLLRPMPSESAVQERLEVLERMLSQIEAKKGQPSTRLQKLELRVDRLERQSIGKYQAARELLEADPGLRRDFLGSGWTRKKDILNRNGIDLSRTQAYDLRKELMAKYGEEGA